jgi:hypothetical protein
LHFLFARIIKEANITAPILEKLKGKVNSDRQAIYSLVAYAFPEGELKKCSDSTNAINPIVPETPARNHPPDLQEALNPRPTAAASRTPM